MLNQLNQSNSAWVSAAAGPAGGPGLLGVGLALGWRWVGVGLTLGWCWVGVGLALGYCPIIFVDTQGDKKLTGKGKFGIEELILSSFYKRGN